VVRLFNFRRLKMGKKQSENKNTTPATRIPFAGFFMPSSALLLKSYYPSASGFFILER
jgi:hypothetical protein